MRKRETRLDKAEAGKAVRIDAARILKATRTPQGFLRVPVHATRVGVFYYLNPDGSVRRELRHPEDVFHADSLATLAGAPITNDHPNVRDPDCMLVTSDNCRYLMVGFTGDDVRQDGDHVAAVATITDPEAIQDVELGKIEVSCGYECERESVPGVYEGEEYDVRQRNIVYNHLAIVSKGRAGPTVRLRLDSADAVQVTSKYLEDSMETIVINGKSYQVSKEVADAWNSYQGTVVAKATLDSVQAALDAERSKVTRAEARADTLETQLQKAKEVKHDSALPDPKAVREAAKKTMRILSIATQVLPAEKHATLDAMEDKDIMKEVIKADSPKQSFEGKSDEYIQVRFDMLAEEIEEKRGEGKKVGTAVIESRADAAKDSEDAEAARRRQRERAEKQWQTESK